MVAVVALLAVWRHTAAVVVRSTTEQTQPFVAVAVSPIVMMVVQVPVAPLTKVPTEPPPTSVVSVQPAFVVNFVPADMYAEAFSLPVVSVPTGELEDPIATTPAAFLHILVSAVPAAVPLDDQVKQTVLMFWSCVAVQADRKELLVVTPGVLAETRVNPVVVEPVKENVGVPAPPLGPCKGYVKLAELPIVT